MNVRTHFIILLSILFILLGCSNAFAAKEISYYVSKSWFKPVLLVNNEPDVCTPILNGYTSFFKSTQHENPLEADFNGKRKHSEALSIIRKGLRELEWMHYRIDGVDYAIAEFSLSGKYHAMVRLFYSIGWREGFFHDILINKPLPEYQLTQKNHMQVFDANEIGVFDKSGNDNIYTIIYPDFGKRKHNDSLIYASFVNIYERNGSIYLSFHTKDLGADTYHIFKLIDEKSLSLTCTFRTTPSSDQIRTKKAELPGYIKLKDNLAAMIGDEGNCGTGHFLGHAQMELNGALERMLYRPWSNFFPPDSPWQEGRDGASNVAFNLSMWGYSGIWNYRIYKEYLSNLPKAENELAKFYNRNFKLNKTKSVELARSSLTYALIVGFDHGSVEDREHVLHRRILDGMKPEELKNDPIDMRISVDGADSLLTFALGQPRLLKVLLDKGLDPNQQNAFGKTPLMYAAQFNDFTAAKMLLEDGAFTEQSTIAPEDTCEHTIRVTNVSALHYAVRYSSQRLIKLLLDHGAPTYMADSKGRTPYDYLVSYGGLDRIGKQSKISYGDANPHLTENARRDLRLALLPPDKDKKMTLARREILAAEQLYREGKLRDALQALKRVLAADPDNEKALSDLSIVALKLGRLGESAEASTKVIKKTKSVAEKANAYFYLGLACKKAGNVAYPSSTIDYNGSHYCRADIYAPRKKKADNSAIQNFLMSYKLQPSQERLNAILSILQDSDPDNKKKRLCKFAEDSSGLKSLYFGADLYFLIDSGKVVPFKKVTGTSGSINNVFNVTEKEDISLTDNLKLERWTVNYSSYHGSVILDDMICSLVFPAAYGTGTKLVELYSSKINKPESASRVITVRQSMSVPSILILYGNNLSWTLDGDLSNTVGVYVHGLSVVRVPSVGTVPVFSNNTAAYPDPKGSSFNPHTSRTSIGLTIDSIVDVGRNEMIVLTDQIVGDNRYVPKAAPAPVK